MELSIIQVFIIGALVIKKGALAISSLIDKKFLHFLHFLDKPIISLQR